MEFLPISNVKPGMRLARAVFSGEGKLLLPPGELLHASHIAMLREWSIETVAIEAPHPERSSEPPGPRPEDLMQSVRQSVAERCTHLDTAAPHIQALFELSF